MHRDRLGWRGKFVPKPEARLAIGERMLTIIRMPNGGSMSTMIRTILVDDELPAQDELNYLLSAYDDIEVVGTAGNAMDAVEAIYAHEPDLVFLDIQMPGKNGFHVLKAAMGMKKTPLVIFVTAYDEYAIRAFEENAVDYVLKPVATNRLDSSLARVRKLLRPEAKDNSGEMLKKLLADVGIKPGITRISVEHSGRNVLLSPREIVYFNYENRRVHAGTKKGVYPCASDLTLDRLEERLGGFPFFRANRAQLVNLALVRTYAPWFNGKYVLTMNDEEETEITVSKARVRDFKEAIEL